MANFRVEYAHQALKCNDVVVKGVQSVTLQTNFNLEPVFELGQLDTYENIETLPEIQITVERILDGNKLLLELATGAASTDTLIDRTNQTCDMELFIYPDSQENAVSDNASTVAAQLLLKTLYISSIQYNLPVNGNMTETITFVGNDKFYKPVPDDYVPTGTFGNDSPITTTQRRQHFVMGSTNGISSKLPSQITGINVNGYNILDGQAYSAHVQDIQISVNLNREDFFEQGQRRPYYRKASFPTVVDTSISITAGGDNPGDGLNADSDSTRNVIDQTIDIFLSDGTRFNLGTKNRILSVDQSGGSTGGESVTYTYQLQGQNVLTVTSPTGDDHPLFLRAEINGAGDELTLEFDEAVTFGAGANGGVTLASSAAAVTTTYASGDGTTTLIYDLSRTVLGSESLRVNYTQPGNGIESDDNNVDVLSFVDQKVVNNSTQS
jgi:hypothetical protein